MRSDTQSVTLDAPAPTVFALLAEPANLPLWAVGFCRAIRPGAEGWIVTTSTGEVGLRYEVNRAAGTIDFRMTPAPGVELTAYSRVISNAEGADYVFTQQQAPGMTDDAFAHQVEALREELAVLRSLVRARAVCAA